MCTFLATQRLFFQTGNCLLCTGREWASLGSPFHAWTDQPVLHHPGIQECPNEFSQPFVLDSLDDLTHQPVVIDPIEKFF
jgi:hypothetical protein